MSLRNPEDEISVIQDGYFSTEDSDKMLYTTDRTFLRNPAHSCRRNYIPSPLSSPASARRISQRLGDQISRHSPKLTRKKIVTPASLSPKISSPVVKREPTSTISCPQCKMEAEKNPMTSSREPVTTSHDSESETFSFLNFCSSILFPSTVKRKKKRSQFLNYFATHDARSGDYQMSSLQQFSDAGRIASRFHDTKWDAWTSMGENVHEYESFYDSEDFTDSDEENFSTESDSSSDGFLEIPLNDMTLSISPRRGK